MLALLRLRRIDQAGRVYHSAFYIRMRRSLERIRQMKRAMNRPRSERAAAFAGIGFADSA